MLGGRSDGDHAVALDGEKCEDASRIGPGVDVDAMRSNVRTWDRGVAVDNELAEILIALKKLISNP